MGRTWRRGWPATIWRKRSRPSRRCSMISSVKRLQAGAGAGAGAGRTEVSPPPPLCSDRSCRPREWHSPAAEDFAGERGDVDALGLALEDLAEGFEIGVAPPDGRVSDAEGGDVGLWGGGQA